MLETERLILRRFTEADANAVFQMRSDAEFMRFIKTPETVRQAVGWMRMVSRYWETDNFGFWAVVLKQTNAVVGWSGTWVLGETKEPEIGFAIARKFAGNGLATEAARVALDYNFKNRNAAKSVALAFPENAASRRVMEKLGMRFAAERYFDSYGKRLVYYEILKDEYARNRQTAAA